MTDGRSSDPNLTFSIRSRRAPVDAADALRRALVAHESIEVHPEEFRDRIGPPYERIVAGRLDGEHVRLRIIGTSAGYRRGFTWGVEFRGAFEPASDGSLLRGEVVLRGRWPLVWFLRLFRVVMGLFFLVAPGAVVLGPAGDPGPKLAILLVATAVMFGATAVMVPLGDRGATEDVYLLREFLRRTLEPQR